MGSASKIVLVGAASLVVGIYAVALKRNQTNDMSTSWSYVKRVQTERIEDAAIRFAAYRVQYNVDNQRIVLGSMTAFTVGATKTALGGGTYTYNLSVPANAYYATGTVTVNPPNEDSKTISIRVDRVYGTGSTGVGTKPGHRRFVRGQFQVTKYFVRTLD